MKPAPFDYAAPDSVAEVLSTLADGGDDAKVLAGGQSLIPLLAMRLTSFDLLVDLRRVEELQGVHKVDGSVRVGSMTLQADAENDPVVAASVPLLARALPHIGHFQIRNRGTIGGSIAHADPAAELPAVALAMDAAIEVAGPGGERSIPAAEFFESTFMTALADSDLVTAVTFPVWGEGSGFAVEEVARRHGDFALVGTTVAVQVDAGVITRAAIALFGAGSTPLRCVAAEEALRGSAPPDVNLGEVAGLALENVEPPDDVHASSDYRRHVGVNVVESGLASALKEAQRG